MLGQSIGPDLLATIEEEDDAQILTGRHDPAGAGFAGPSSARRR